MILEQNGTGVEGNTKPQRVVNTKARAWCFTCFDDKNYNLSIFESLLKSKGRFIVGLETCPTTNRKHFQGYINCKNPIFFNSLVKTLPKGTHVEKAKGSDEDNYKYCSKEGNFISNMVIKKSAGKFIEPEIIELKDWQKDVIQIIDGDRDSRTINWIVDKTGNNGKTWLCKYILKSYNNCIYFRGGKANDIASQVIKQEEFDPEICLFDLPRSCDGAVSYNAMEQLKDGIVHTNKYEGGFKVFDSPHIVVFSNFEPDEEQLSVDRWNIVYLL